MADRIIIRVDGAAPNLASFFNAVAAQADQLRSRLEGIYEPVMGAKVGLQGGSRLIQKQIGGEMKAVGAQAKLTAFQIDHLNNVMKATVQTGLQIGDQFLPVSTMTEYFSTAEKGVEALGRVAQTEGELNRVRERYAARRAKENADYAAAQARVGAADQARGRAAADLMNAQAGLASAQQRVADITSAPPGTYSARQEAAARGLLTRRTNEVAAATAAWTQAEAAHAAALNNPVYAQHAQRLTTIARGEVRATNAATRAAASANADFMSAMAGAPENLPKGYTQLPTSVQRRLTKLGLSTDPATMWNQQRASFGTPILDLERGLMRFNGEWTQTKMIGGQATEALVRWNATTNLAGKEIQSTGRQLRGFSRMWEMIGRDFAKVIEWTIATTVVFGTLRVAMMGFDMIKTLDADLTRFGVTAGMTGAQVKTFYGNLRDVAQSTATPLEELIKSADDLALAVSRPGQTIKELTRDVSLLAEAVGVYTNLTGADTVSATDQLVAVMKQLGLTSEDVYIILNKVTASAGGQSGAIADITKGLAVMAEAGKQAGLTVDQQIGTIKTLSQVTSKSPAEVATAFKNLVGALENPAAIKALKNLNIALISEGNDIIGIYTEISNKIKSGEIASTDVSGLLRAISGGPRRAPDAAALLSNINTVLKETRVSQNATNEAFLANALIMDTLNAKFIIFQNTLKDITFTQFGEVFKTLAVDGVEALTAFLEVFGKIDPQLITTIAQLGIFLLGIKAIMKVLSYLKLTSSDVWTSMVLGIGRTRKYAKMVKDDFKEIQKATQAGGIRGGIGAAGFLGYGVRARRVGQAGMAGAATGAALGAMTGGGPQQIIGGGLQGLGMALMMMPDPSMLTKVAGGVSLVAGTFLQLQQNTEESTRSTDEFKKEVINAYQSAKSAAETISALAEDQNVLASQIDQLQAKEKLNGEEQARLISLTKDYTTSVMNMTEAHKGLNEALEHLKDLLPEFATQLSDISFLGADELQRVVDAYIQSILDIEYPDRAKNGMLPAPGLVGGGRTKRKVTPVVPTQSTDYMASYERDVGYARAGARVETHPSGKIEYLMTEQIDLRKIGEDEKALIAVIENMAATGTASFQVTSENLGLLNKAIADVKDEDLRTKLQGIVDAFGIKNSALYNIADTIGLYQKAIDAMMSSGADTEKAGKFSKQLKGIEQAIQAAFKPESGLTKRQATIYANDVLTAFQTAFNKKELLPESYMEGIATDLATYTKDFDFANASADEQRAIIEQILINWGLVNQALIDQTALIEANAAAMAEFSKYIDQQQASLAETMAQAQADFKGEIIDQDTFNGIMESSQGAFNALEMVRGKMQEIAETSTSFNIDVPLADQGPALEAVAESLSHINGLQDAASLSATELVTRMFSLADVFNMTGKQTVNLGKDITRLLDAVATISNVKATFHIEGDAAQAIAVLERTKDALIAMVNVAHATGGKSAGSMALIGRIKKLEQTISALKQANKTISSIAHRYATAPGTPKPSSGGSSSSRQGKDYGELDLPEELSGLPNRDALIRQAIRNARALQKKIPGAAKEGKNDVVTILDGMQKLETVRGIREDLLRRALEDLAAIEKKRLEFESKADTIRRIRVGGGDFAAIANVPVNSVTGVSVGGPSGPINITLNLNGTVMTPAQYQQFADRIAAAIKRQLS